MNQDSCFVLPVDLPCERCVFDARGLVPDTLAAGTPVRVVEHREESVLIQAAKVSGRGHVRWQRPVYRVLRANLRSQLNK